jgi:hypothetical protein
MSAKQDLGTNTKTKKKLCATTMAIFAGAKRWKRENPDSKDARERLNLQATEQRRAIVKAFGADPDGAQARQIDLDRFRPANA